MIFPAHHALQALGEQLLGRNHTTAMFVVNRLDAENVAPLLSEF